MSNRVEESDEDYLVLISDDGRHSLWPQFAAVPPGWRVQHGPDTRRACLDHIERNRSDARPRGAVTPPGR